MNKKNLLIILTALLLPIVVYVLYLMNVPVAVYYTIGWIVVVLTLLILGNGFISKQFDTRFPWLKYGNRRFFTHLFIGIGYSLILINLAYLIFKMSFTNELPTWGQLIVTNVYGLVIFIPAFCVYFSLHFLKHWQKSELETEKFKKETLKSQFDNLKNHLDPHFLFNNLNILSALIDKDVDRSKEFLDKFADVYRSLLKTKEEGLISLEDELKFIEAYVYLLKTRFEENAIFKIEVNKDVIFKMIPPLTLQLLLENVIKHNQITENRPLIVEITSKGDAIQVCNSLFAQKFDNGNTSGSGLENIKMRYAYFSEQKVIVEESDSQFCVTVPLIEVETI